MPRDRDQLQTPNAIKDATRQVPVTPDVLESAIRGRDTIRASLREKNPQEMGLLELFEGIIEASKKAGYVNIQIVDSTEQVTHPEEYVANTKNYSAIRSPSAAVAAYLTDHGPTKRLTVVKELSDKYGWGADSPYPKKLLRQGIEYHLKESDQPKRFRLTSEDVLELF